AGDEAVALAQDRGDVRNLEAPRLARIDGATEQLEPLHEKGANKVGLQAARLRLFHFFLHCEQALGAEGFLGERVPVEQGSEMFTVKVVLDALAESGPNLGAVAVANRLDE